MVETDLMSADQFTLSAFESAVVLGPFSAQAEYKASMANSDAYNDPRVSGYYVMASYFLTGESRPYKYGDGCFDRVKPKKPLGEGAGAWQLAARYSYVDLTEGNGGKLNDYVVGLNWYLNNNARFMFNYIYSETKDLTPANTKFSGFQTRFSVYF
jgi:phosphate-selective porin OprO/OprP